VAGGKKNGGVKNSRIARSKKKSNINGTGTEGSKNIVQVEGGKGGKKKKLLVPRKSALCARDGEEDERHASNYTRRNKRKSLTRGGVPKKVGKEGKWQGKSKTTSKE